MTKKIISSVLALAMVLSLFCIVPFSAGAATSGDFEYELLDDGTAEITGYNGSAKDLTIPDTLDGHRVSGIGMSAFLYCKSLESITIPNSVTSIGMSAFSNCTNLESITIPNSVTYIGKKTFFNTAWYDNQPDGVVYVGKVAYEYKGEMPENTSITLKDGTISIADSAFFYCYNLESITIPDSVTNIYEAAFQYCFNLTTITIGNSVTNIGDHTFSGCGSLKSVAIPNSVTSIGYQAFYGCKSLTSVAIPNSVTSIDEKAFETCTSLTSVTVPNSVTYIGSFAFGYFDSADIEGYEKVDGFTIYGTKGSEAERYANENDFAFIEVKEHTDEETKIEVDVAGDVTLNVEKISKQDESKIIEILDKNENLVVAHDITLLQGETPVQPENIATVKIPVPQGVDGKTLKVYRINDDNTKTDMNAVFEENFMVFSTDHFSTYALVGTKAEKILGDADRDGKVTIIDATTIQKWLAQMITEDEIDLSVCDVDHDNSVTVVDATLIQKYLAGIINEL